MSMTQRLSKKNDLVKRAIMSEATATVIELESADTDSDNNDDTTSNSNIHVYRGFAYERGSSKMFSSKAQIDKYIASTLDMMI